jgi:hypothetical protein
MAESYPPPPSYYESQTITTQPTSQIVDTSRMREYQLVELIQKHNISSSLAKMLYVLKEFDIVLLVDDSASMGSSNTLIDPNTNQITTTTRWREAQTFTNTLVDFAMTLDDDGIDIYFLNRPSIFKVQNKSVVDAAFHALPNGGTPIVRTLNQIYTKYQHNEKNVLVIIITDGEPTDAGSENADLLAVFNRIFSNTNPQFRISMMICSDDEIVLSIYNEIDRRYDEFDLSDDFVEERRQIMRVQGRQFSFEYGDYICKILLAPICKQLDMLDEKKLDVNYIVKTFTKTYDDYGLQRAMADSKSGYESISRTIGNKCIVM